MAIGSPPITRHLKDTRELWVYIGAPLPNPSGNTGRDGNGRLKNLIPEDSKQNIHQDNLKKYLILNQSEMESSVLLDTLISSRGNSHK